MTPLLARKPSLPMGEVFLPPWMVERPLFCAQEYEFYRVKDAGKEAALGVVFRCRNRQEGEKYLQLHLNWWKILGEDRLKMLAHEICERSDFYLGLAILSTVRNVAQAVVNETPLLYQKHAESLLLDLVKICKVGIAQGLLPIVQLGEIMLGINEDRYFGIPILVASINEKESQNEETSIESIAALIYALSTGIDPKEYGTATSTKKGGLPSASRWNKDINKKLSSILGLCLDKTDSQKIKTFEALEEKIHGVSMEKAPQPREAGAELPERERREKTQSASGLAKVAGMVKLKNLLVEDVIRPIRDPEPFKRYGLSIPNGILLYGPPGCGKTFIAGQLAEEMGWYFKKVIGSDVGSSFIHGSILAIRDLFAEAEEHAPTMVFIDEIEGLVPKRSDMSGLQQFKSEEVNEFLSQLNECASKKIFVIAATNEPQKIDEALLRPGRIDKKIYVEPPDFEARIDLLKMYLSSRPLAVFDFDNYAKMLQGYSCSDIRNITDEAARLALRDSKSIERDHIIEAIRRNPSSLSPEVISKYGDFQQRGI